MLLVTLTLGSLVGSFVAVIAKLAFDFSVLGAFALYMACALAPVIVATTFQALRLAPRSDSVRELARR